MVYKEFQNTKLSALGMGAMRLPVIDGDDSRIDKEAAKQMVAYAMEHGVNYYDTAWGYHSGRSESVMGGLLSEYPRERFYLATKFPGYDLSNMGKVREIFERQLEKCRVDYFDFYLFHTVTEENIDLYLDERYGLLDYILEQKRRGHIRHLGFSCHGRLPVLKRFLDTWGEHLEFCQLQVNYVDWLYQGAQEKVELVRSYGLPIWVMEPLRGGTLAEFHPEDAAFLEAVRPGETAPGWAFRFLQGLSEVSVVLSGMSTMEQLRENVALFGENVPLKTEETESLLAVARNILKRTTVFCTDCRYCVSHCPQGLNIPALVRLYNECAFSGQKTFWPEDVAELPPHKRPTACAACGSCEKVCPQGIRISEVMARFQIPME